MTQLGLGPKAIIAVAEVDDPLKAAELARVLADSGIDALEITFRTPTALAALESAVNAETITVGAGTVLDTETLLASVEAGADFVISPGFDADLLAAAATAQMPAIPGVITPTEVQAAMRAGYSTVKLFPAERFGGIALLQTLGAVFGAARFIPTGGVTHELALEYFAHPQVVGIGGSWIAPRAVVAAGDWAEISRRATAIRTARSSTA